MLSLYFIQVSAHVQTPDEEELKREGFILEKKNLQLVCATLFNILNSRLFTIYGALEIKNASFFMSASDPELT